MTLQISQSTEYSVSSMNNYLDECVMGVMSTYINRIQLSSYNVAVVPRSNLVVYTNHYQEVTCLCDDSKSVILVLKQKPGSHHRRLSLESQGSCKNTTSRWIQWFTIALDFPLAGL